MLSLYIDVRRAFLPSLVFIGNILKLFLYDEGHQSLDAIGPTIVSDRRSER
jgi:hypothetical protein